MSNLILTSKNCGQSPQEPSRAIESDIPTGPLKLLADTTSIRTKLIFDTSPSKCILQHNTFEPGNSNQEAMAQTSQPEVKIRPAVFPDDKAIVGKLFLAYAQGLPISLDFQNFETELEALPGKYAVEKGGAVYLAYTVLPIASSSSSTANGHAESQQSPSEQIIGCVAIRPFAPPRQCELKRLYLTPESRGLGVSKLLLELAIRQARQLGYKEMLLDTLSSMTAARTLYERYGFEEIGSYYDSVEDAVFYRLVL